MTIYQTPYFLVYAPPNPLIDRHDGGHIVIDPIKKVRDRQQLTPTQAIELMRLTIVVGKAMTKVMNAHGVDIGRINYQDNGNWGVLTPEGPWMHVHLYGRAKSAKIQVYGQATYFPHREENPAFYATLLPLTKEDCAAIATEIIKLLALPAFQDENWNLNTGTSPDNQTKVGNT